MRDGQTALKHDGIICSFPDARNSFDFENRKQLADSLELLRLVQYLVYSIKEIAAAREVPLRVLSCLANGEEIAPRLSTNFSSPIRNCAHEQLKKLEELSRKYMEVSYQSVEW
jgi:predicted DNA-binding ribbon-helix-helix protein